MISHVLSIVSISTVCCWRSCSDLQQQWIPHLQRHRGKNQSPENHCPDRSQLSTRSAKQSANTHSLSAAEDNALLVQLLAEMVIGNESRFPTRAILPLESGRRIHIVLKFGLEHFDKVPTHLLLSVESHHRVLCVAG